MPTCINTLKYQGVLLNKGRSDKFSWSLEWVCKTSFLWQLAPRWSVEKVPSPQADAVRIHTLCGDPVVVATEYFCQGKDAGIRLERCPSTSFPALESSCKSQETAGREVASACGVCRFSEEKLRKKIISSAPLGCLHVIFWLGVHVYRRCTTSTTPAPSASQQTAPSSRTPPGA